MSTPQQPWSPGQPTPTDRPAADGDGAASGYGSPQGHGAPQGQGAPLAYGGPQAYGAQAAPGSAAPGYGTPAYGTSAYGPQQGYGAPQGQPQPYGGGPTGELVVNLRKPFGAMGMISPMLMIDGHPASATWGRNSFQVPAGVRQVDIAQTYLWTYGRASQPVNVEAGRPSEIFYSGPMATFGFGGAIGTAPQRRPGTGLFIGLMVFVGVLLLLVVVLAVAFGGS